MPSLTYRQSGNGTPIVLIHGFPFNSTQWDAQLSDLAADHRVILVDLPGFGANQPPKPFTIQSIAIQLHDLLKSIDALPCVLGGLSMGGYYCMEFARLFPSSLKALLLICTRADADSPEGKENRNRMIHIALEKGAGPIADAMEPKLLSPSTTDAVKKQIRAMMDSTPANTIAYCLEALRDRPDSTDSLRLISTPTLIVGGKADGIAPVSVPQGMHASIKNSELALFDNLGHMAPMENPQLFNNTVREFLRKSL